MDWVDGSFPRSFKDNYTRFDRALYGRYGPLDDPNDEHHTVWSIYRYPVRMARVRARAGDPRFEKGGAQPKDRPLPDSDPESDPEPPDYESPEEDEFTAPKPKPPGYKGVRLIPNPDILTRTDVGPPGLQIWKSNRPPKPPKLDYFRGRRRASAVREAPTPPRIPRYGKG